MILTVELPQELLHRLQGDPLRLGAMRGALLTANLEGVYWGTRSVTVTLCIPWEGSPFAELYAAEHTELLRSSIGLRSTETALDDSPTASTPPRSQSSWSSLNRRASRRSWSTAGCSGPGSLNLSRSSTSAGRTRSSCALSRRLSHFRVHAADSEHSNRCAQLGAVPHTVQKLLDAIANSVGSFCLLDLGPSGRTSDLVTLAGILLDYEVAYSVAGETGSNCLGGRELALIEAFSITARGQRFARQICVGLAPRGCVCADRPSLRPAGTLSSPFLTRSNSSLWHRRSSPNRLSPRSTASFRTASIRRKTSFQNSLGSRSRSNRVP